MRPRETGDSLVRTRGRPWRAATPRCASVLRAPQGGRETRDAIAVEDSFDLRTPLDENRIEGIAQRLVAAPNAHRDRKGQTHFRLRVGLNGNDLQTSAAREES